MPDRPRTWDPLPIRRMTELRRVLDTATLRGAVDALPDVTKAKLADKAKHR